MSQETETLNIEHHLKILVVKAIKKHWEERIVAEVLGVSPRTLLRYKKRFGIKKEWLTKEVIVLGK